MKVFCNGFNLYDQFEYKEHLIENFTECDLESANEIEVSLTYCILQLGNQLYLRGGKYEDLKQIALKTEIKIVSFCCDTDRILILLRNGDIFKVDYGDPCLVFQLPKPEYLEEGDKIVHISAGSTLTVASSLNGNIYNLPNKMKFSNKDIIDIKTGREHCLILIKNGDVFSFGGGSRGQLGHGTLDDETEPKLINALAGIKIVAIACGGWHSCALSNSGDLYSWGWNSNGQLGMKSAGSGDAPSVMALPLVIDFDNLQAVVTKIACGARHTIALLRDGSLYGCGWNKYKQLFNVETVNVYGMTYLHNFDKQNVKSLKCGPWNSVVVCH